MARHINWTIKCQKERPRGFTMKLHPLIISNVMDGWTWAYCELCQQFIEVDDAEVRTCPRCKESLFHELPRKEHSRAIQQRPQRQPASA